jgi:chaperone modulatory protein CbpM
VNEGSWLSETHEFSFSELVELSGLAANELQELIDIGVLTPLRSEATAGVFASQCLLTVRTAARLRQGFDLEPHGLAVAVALLGRIRDLETQLEQLGARLPRSFR